MLRVFLLFICSVCTIEFRLPLSAKKKMVKTIAASFPLTEEDYSLFTEGEKNNNGDNHRDRAVTASPLSWRGSCEDKDQTWRRIKWRWGKQGEQRSTYWLRGNASPLQVIQLDISFNIL